MYTQSLSNQYNNNAEFALYTGIEPLNQIRSIPAQKIVPAMYHTFQDQNIVKIKKKYF